MKPRPEEIEKYVGLGAFERGSSAEAVSRRNALIESLSSPDGISSRAVKGTE